MPFRDARAAKKDIERTRVLVRSEDRESGSEHDYVFRLPRLFQNVIGIEVAGWNFDALSLPTFVANFDGIHPEPGTDVTSQAASRNTASMVDVLIEDEFDPPTATAAFTVDVSNVSGFSYCGLSFTSPDELEVVLQAAFEAGFGALGLSNPNVNASNTSIEVGVDELERLTFTAFRTASPYEPMKIYLLFGTGANRDNQMSRALGFEPYEDTTLPATLTFTPSVGSQNNYLLTAPYRANTRPFRYLELNIHESEFAPHERIYLDPRIPVYGQDNGIVELVKAQKTNRASLRLFTNTLRRLERVGITLTLPQGLRVPLSARKDHVLELDIFSLSEQTDLPQWARAQTIAI